MGRRRSHGVTSLLSDLLDDIKDFVDDEILERSRGTEKDVRRAGRDVADDRSRRRAGRTRDNLDDLRKAVAALAGKVDSLVSRDSGDATVPAVDKPGDDVPAVDSEDAGQAPPKLAVVKDPPAEASRPAASKPPAAKSAAAAKPAAAKPAVKPAAAKPAAKPAAAKPAVKPAAAKPVARSAATSEPGTATKVPAQRSPGARRKEPWAGYDAQTVSQVRQGLAEAEPSEVRAVLGYEAAHKNRRGVLAAAEAALKP